MKGFPYFALVATAAFAADYGERMTVAAMETTRPAVTFTETAPAVAPVAPTAVASETSLADAMSRDIVSQLARRMKASESDFEVSIEGLRLDPSIPSGQIVSVQVLGLGVSGASRLEGLFRLPLSVQYRQGASMREQEIYASGVLKVTGPVFVARKAMPSGHIIAAEDLSVVRLPWRALPTQALGQGEKEFVGSRVKSFISSGQPVQITQLEEPFAVKPGEPVELTVLSGPGVIIRSRGVAKQEGRVGDTVRIEQPDTKKILSGLVVGAKSVEVQL